MQRLVLFMWVILFAPGAQSGIWSGGGGGEVLEHAQNPWFLDLPNSAPVRYCVGVGGDFPVPLHDLEDLVANAISWWDLQFSNAFYPQNLVWLNDKLVNYSVHVNTSRFLKEPCSDTTELAFQFGYTTPEQTVEFEKQKIDLTRFIGLTIRTDYSDALRGKGFIYFSPDRGPKAFTGQNIIPNVWTADWSSKSRLNSVIVHELGHVLGLGHASNNESIMSARLAELMVTKDNNTELPSISNAVFFPKVGQAIYDCAEQPKNQTFRKYFLIPDAMHCVRVTWSLNALTVYVAKDENSGQPFWQKWGTARFLDGGQRRHHQLVSVWLPQVREVLKEIPSYMTFLQGPASTEVQQTGTFTFEKSTEKRSVFLQVSPRYIQIGGVVGDILIPDLYSQTGYGQSVSGWSE